MTDDVELRSISVKLDGRESIEHQLDIHVLDLVESSHNPDIQLADVLAGIQYVVEYRILGGKMPNLSYDIMARLAEGLLAIMPKRTGSLLSKKFTPEANLSFVLFGQFLEEVEEFRKVVNEKSASDLLLSFVLHKRLEQEEITASFLSVVLKHCYQISDWRELVKEDDQDKIQTLMEKYADKFKDPGMITPTEAPFPPQVLYFDKNSEKLAKMFSSDTTNGLPHNLVSKYREHYGTNKIPEPPKPSIIRMILAQFTDFMIVILLVVAIVDFFTDEVAAGVALVLVVILNATIGFTQELKAKKALDALTALHVPVAKVIRDGQTSVVDAAELVPGDLVVLDEGDVVPADMRLCEVAQLEVIEVILTGESLGVPKSTRTIRKRTRKLPLGDCKGNVFMATVVARGRGKGIVVRVGDSSEVGRISQAISATPHEKTNLEQKLNSLGKYLVALAVVMCLIIIFISLGYRRDTKETLLLGVSLAVSVIPESLVAVVTVAMALGVKRMAEQNAIVRKLPAVESLGSVGVICSDKTGTLTEGKMGASALWTSDGASYVFTESTNINPEAGNINLKNGSELTPIKKQPAHSGPNLMAAMMSASLCNNSSIVKDPETSEWKTIGDPTEIAMLVAGRKVGISREWLQDAIGLEKIGEFAFDSDRKMMSVIYEQGTRIKNHNTFAPGTTFILAKGAPEGILKNCSGYLPKSASGSHKDLSDLSSSPLSDSIVEQISQESLSMARLGLRVLAFAIRVVSSSEASEIIKSNKSANSETNLTFAGLIGLIDPPKNGVKKSVETCHAAGIKVIMITGDHISTAVAIAKQLSIIEDTDNESAVSMKGYEVDLLSEEHLAALKPFPRVFARVSPDNKLKIIKALQKRGESVSMTGDGVNDAPAIKKANVGVAMGISGTEITKQAADIVLADDNFTTIVVAVKEGRLVFDNIRKFCSYILACSASEVILFLAAAIRNSGEPFGKLPILYANIIADVPPALSLGLEPAEADIMQRKPRPIKEHVVTLKIGILVLINGLVISMISFAAFILSKTIKIFGDDSFLHDHTKQESLTFAVMVMGHLLQSFLSKSVFNSIFTTGVTNNIWMIIAFLSSFGLLVLGIEAPVIQGWLEFTGIGGTGWAVVFISGLVHICTIEIIFRLNRVRQKFAMGITDKIADIEKEISRTQKNKATEYHLGLLKAKLAKYRAMLLEPAGKSGPKGVGFDVVRSGDARVALIGFPSGILQMIEIQVGKSTLLNKVTETKSEIGAYEFTTLTCVPGKISFNGAQIQLLDLPGIIEGAAQGIGRGRQVIAVAKTSDLILMMLDATKGPKQRELLEAELEAVGIRINTNKPNIYFKVKKGGGISFNGTCKLTHLNERIVYSILHDYKIHNAEVLVREDATVDEFIDVVLGTRRYIKCIYCYNKIDQITIEEVDELARRENTVVVSCEMDLNMDSLIATIWHHLDLIRIYTKKRGEFPDFDGGLILKRGCTVEDVCRNIHKSLLDEFKFALVWGSSAKHNAQRVGMSHVCEDEDVIQIVKKKS